MQDTAFRPLSPLIKLPPSEWKIKPGGPGYFAVSIYARGDDVTRHWQKWSVFDFPNDLFGIEDLVNAGLFLVYMTAVNELKGGAAPAVDRLPDQGFERG